MLIPNIPNWVVTTRFIDNEFQSQVNFNASDAKFGSKFQSHTDLAKLNYLFDLVGDGIYGTFLSRKMLHRIFDQIRNSTIWVTRLE